MKPIISIWTELNRKKSGRDYISGCEYTMESFGGQQKKFFYS